MLTPHIHAHTDPAAARPPQVHVHADPAALAPGPLASLLLIWHITCQLSPACAWGPCVPTGVQRPGSNQKHLSAKAFALLVPQKASGKAESQAIGLILGGTATLTPPVDLAEPRGPTG